MLCHADRGIAPFPHSKSHICIRCGRLGDCQRVGKLISFIRCTAIHFTNLYIDVRHPNFVNIPGYFSLTHPKRLNGNLVLRAFIIATTFFIIRAAHDELTAGDWYKFDFISGMFDYFCIRLHLLFRGSYAFRNFNRCRVIELSLYCRSQKGNYEKGRTEGFHLEKTAGGICVMFNFLL